MKAMQSMKSSQSKKPMKTVYIKTQGCQMNEYDSRRLFELLKTTHGLDQVENPEDADLLLLNTCAIREKAEEKVFSELGRWRNLKEKRPDVVIGVGGCVASQEGEELQKRAPYVDLVFGPQTLHRLPNLIAQLTKTKSPQIDISFPEIEKFDRLPDPIAEGPSAYVSIMEGCNKYCSFCVVPYTRGEEIHRPFDDILHEVVTLAKQGVKEITLLGQNVNAYRGKMHTGEIADLALLIHYISVMDEIERIRFTTSHPLEFSDSLIQAYADIPKLANHLHLPLQSGSNRILGLMKRGHSVEEYKEKIAKLRAVRPDISITSDFIVGFPGETDADFEATLNLVQEINFDQSYSFIYSKRPGTPAALIPDPISHETKKARLNILQARLTQQAAAFSQALLGTEQTVLVTGPSPKDPSKLSGRIDSYRIVILNDATPNLIQSAGHSADSTHSAHSVSRSIQPPATGSFGRVKITELGTYTLRGEWLG